MPYFERCAAWNRERGICLAGSLLQLALEGLLSGRSRLRLDQAGKLNMLQARDQEFPEVSTPGTMYSTT